MKRAVLTTTAVMCLAFSGAALAVPPTLNTVGQQDRHPTASFSAPRADFASIYLSSKPDRATDGSFLQENIKELDSLTDSEIQSGRWVDENQIDPGTYWVILSASPDFGACYLYDSGGFDPACADGFSNVLTLTVPKPTIHYTAGVTAYRYSRLALLELRANPLGERVPYRVCYRLKNHALRCLNGALDGYGWNSSASDSLTVSTRSLPTIATFSWYVGGSKVATKRARTR